MAAFDALTELVKRAKGKAKKCIFIDEAPWIDTPKSGFLTAFEYFWNSFASARKDILLIMCGSATSWMTDKLLKNKGSLHNRVTAVIYLRPFTLRQCELYFDEAGISMSRYDIAECYMIFGGVAHYLTFFEPGQSLSQNIDRILFAQDAPLRYEYDTLYASLFKRPENYMSVVEALSKVAKGMTREELLLGARLNDGGTFTKILADLELSGFIGKYSAYPGRKKGILYQLTDNFSLFYLRFMRGNSMLDEHFWSHMHEMPKLNTWRGYAYEQVCLKHIEQIKTALGIGGVLTSVTSWRSKESKPAAQIDLVIERSDHLINLCEIKYSKYEYEITKEYESNLRNKMAAFASETRTKYTLHLTMLTTFGVKQNKHSGLVHSQVCLDDLFGR
jgi:hypothetical protein